MPIHNSIVMHDDLGFVMMEQNTQRERTSFIVSKDTYATLYHPSSIPDTILLQSLRVEEAIRGYKVGSHLMELAIGHARAEGFDYFQTVAKNERTAKLFDRFEPEDILISTFDHDSQSFVPADISLPDAIGFLAVMRAEQSTAKRHDAALDQGIVINARL